MKKLITFSFFLGVTLALFSCKKNQLGGKATVKGTVSHHSSKTIADAYIYIKYNATEFPGDDYTLYDTYVKADASGNYSISLYKGNYYLYAKGYDYSIPPPYIVKGGLSVSIRNNEHLMKDIAVGEE